MGCRLKSHRRSTTLAAIIILSHKKVSQTNITQFCVYVCVKTLKNLQFQLKLDSKFSPCGLFPMGHVDA